MGIKFTAVQDAAGNIDFGAVAGFAILVIGTVAAAKHLPFVKKFV